MKSVAVPRGRGEGVAGSEVAGDERAEDSEVNSNRSNVLDGFGGGLEENESISDAI